MNISSINDCCNCGSCYNICPHHAISVDGDGTFYTPKVDPELCTDCGLCVQHCSSIRMPNGVKAIGAYAGWHRDSMVVRSSSSGGIFHGLAEAVIAQEGIVYGAVYTNDCTSVIFASTDQVDLKQMQKSKYVESLVGDSFQEIRTHLAKGRKVLFCGTPCQCAGLRSYLGREDENLLLCDFACGGLPSHQIYRDYLSSLESRYGSKVSFIDFRPKTHGWRRYAVLAKFANGRIYNRLGTEDVYLRSFLYGKYTVRNNCLNCKFSDNHLSDLTIADFWKNKNYPSLNNDRGVSLVLCNTRAGQQALEAIHKNYYLESLDLREASYNNKKTIASYDERERHDAFLHTYREKGFMQAYHQAFPVSWRETLKNFLSRWIRRQSQ